MRHLETSEGLSVMCAQVLLRRTSEDEAEVACCSELRRPNFILKIMIMGRESKVLSREMIGLEFNF